jgi:hypothetical protein
MPFKNPHPLYSVWQSMKRRCANQKSKSYHRYGGRGIYVCERWLHNFNAFVADMGERPPKHTLERIDNDGPYSPINCKWATRAEQQLNRDIVKRFVVDGVEVVPAIEAKRLGIKSEIITNRILRGEPLERVFSTSKLHSSVGAESAWQKSVAVRLARTHCKHGHEWSAENTSLSPEGWRRCKKCHAEKARRYTQAKKMAA